MRGSQMTETVADMEIGDKGETLVAMNLRSEIDFKSEIVGSLQEGVAFTVVETGANHRALVSNGDASGWISTKTDLDQSLAKRLEQGTGVLPCYETVVQLGVRESMDYKSTVMFQMPAGTQFDYIEMGPQHIRFKILVDGTIGWITAKTDLGQLLVKDMSGEAKNMSKGERLDTHVVKMASKSQMTKVLSSKSAGRGEERVMSTARSVDELLKDKSPGQASSSKTPPKLSKLACCCG